ncbi:hypothetical protein RHO14_04230 [Orbus wheelerorum]|uniref:hypothetical protein n=1 Tax=Orbus wheelerorum TaxID=3074111 RepID=UPI00370D462C
MKKVIMIFMVIVTFWVGINIFIKIYNTDKFIEQAIELRIKNNPNIIEFHNGKDSEYVEITSGVHSPYCILILSSRNNPLSKGQIYFNQSKDKLIDALKTAYLNPDKLWWSIDLYHKDNLNQPYDNLAIIPDPSCYNGGLTLDIIESKPPNYFVAVRNMDSSIHSIGFIHSEKKFDKKNFDFVNLGFIYMKNGDKFELLSCELTKFNCNEKKYFSPYIYKMMSS